MVSERTVSTRLSWAVLDPASIYIDRPDMIGVVVGVPEAERLDETPQPVTAESGRPPL
jgi:hypothetical protein